MDKLSEFQCFLRVSATGSFTGAASALGITPSAASKQVKSLEARLGARLFNRTTRHVSLTEVGRAFRERISHVLLDVEEAELSVSQLSDEPRGLLRVSAPMDFGRAHLSGPIASFAAMYEALEVEVEFADRFVDVVEEGFDVVVRIGLLADSSLVARYLGPCRRVLCAAPSYLAARREPREIADLAEHTRVAYSYESERSWTFAGPSGPVRVTVPIRHRSNNGALTRSLILGGQGLASRATLQQWSRGRKVALRQAQRAKMILRAAAGELNQEIAAQLGVKVHTVGRWRNRFSDPSQTGHNWM